MSKTSTFQRWLVVQTALHQHTATVLLITIPVFVNHTDVNVLGPTNLKSVMAHTVQPGY